MHKWKYQNTPATLKSDGLNFYICSCGKTKVGKIIYRPKTISLSKTKYTYDGCAHRPKVVVKDRKGNVISPSNYKVTYSKGLTKKGTYTVKITFKGKYFGSVKKQFKIV
nr:bacterial Ig-like domain-containing protein [uncultured Blautia sp.]